MSMMTTSQSIQWSPFGEPPLGPASSNNVMHMTSTIYLSISLILDLTLASSLGRTAGVQGRKVVESWRGRLHRCCPHCQRRLVCCAWLVSGPFSRLVVRFGWLDGGSELAGDGMNYPAWLILPYTLFSWMESMPYISEPHSRGSWADFLVCLQTSNLVLSAVLS